MRRAVRSILWISFSLIIKFLNDFFLERLFKYFSCPSAKADGKGLVRQIYFNNKPQPKLGTLNLKPGTWNFYTQASSRISPLMLTMISFTGTLRDA